MRLVSTFALGMLLACGIFACQGEQAIVPRDHSNDVAEEGMYRNDEYGYTVSVPQGLKAYRMKAPAPQHGIMLDLNKGELWVNGEYDAILARSVDAIALSTAELWSAHDQLRVVGISSTPLSGLAARDVVLERESFEGRINYVHLVVAYRAIPNGVGVVYTIGIQARTKNAPDEKLFSALVDSFHLTDLPNRGSFRQRRKPPTHNSEK